MRFALTLLLYVSSWQPDLQPKQAVPPPPGPPEGSWPAPIPSKLPVAKAPPATPPSMYSPSQSDAGVALERLIEELRKERAELKKSRFRKESDDGDDHETGPSYRELGQKLDALLAELESRRSRMQQPIPKLLPPPIIKPKIVGKIPPGAHAKPSAKKSDGHETEHKDDKTNAHAQPIASGPLPNDPLSLGLLYFRAKKWEQALAAFKTINIEKMPAERRMPIEYLMASCLVELDKDSDAEAIFRDLSKRPGDNFIRNMARFRLNSLLWRREVIQKLEDLRKRQKQAGEGL